MTDPALLYNGFTASDPEAQRKNEIESVIKLLEQNPNNPYWQNRYNELVIKPIYGENWEADADRLHELLTSDVPHPVEEAYQMDIDTETNFRLSQIPKNVTASKTWLKRNTHGSPEEREQARKNSEMLKSIRSGI